MISVPGKIFIFGEYSVMNGGEAVLASVKPDFECGWSNTTRVHPDSPAGRFLSENNTQIFIKVEGGLGAGFGSSTAELISANEYLDQPWSSKRLWSWYHQNFVPASGADLAVQDQSRKDGHGFYHFQTHEPDYRLNKINVPTDFQKNCFIFHSPPTQKIPTYSDLENKRDQSIEINIADQFIHRWLRSFDPKVLTEWADYLAKIGYESLFAHQVRKSFLSIKGVLGVKGCGAGLNDVFLVCVDQSLPQKMNHDLTAVVEKYKLKSLGSMMDHV